MKTIKVKVLRDWSGYKPGDTTTAIPTGSIELLVLRGIVEVVDDNRPTIKPVKPKGIIRK